MATDEDASRAGFERADVPEDCDISGLTPSDPEVYTKPQMRDRIKAEIYCSDKGGDPGEWSARKAQLTVQRYEAEGGGYEDESEFTDSQRDLMVWTEQDWEYGGDEEARYLPKDFWETLSEEEKEKVNETKKEGSEEGKQFVSLPDEIQEQFADWREENREKYLEDARENPPGEDLRQRSLARDAFAVLQNYIETWEPRYQPRKLELTRAIRDGDFWNVLRADARLLGFSGPLTPLHFLFFENNRVAGGAALYRTKNLGVRGLPDEEPGIFLRFFDEGWTEEGKVVEEEEINDSTFLRQNGSVVSKVEGFGTPKLYYSFETVHSALEVATPPTDPQAPSVGLGDFVELEPWDLDPDEFVDRLVQHVRLASPTQNKMQTSKPDDAERALREAVSNLRALKRQLDHVLQEKKTTFIHEFQHHFDRSRMPEGAVVGSSTLTGRAGLPTDEYFNTEMEVNARYQEGLAEFEEVMLSDPDFMRSEIKNGFDERDLIRLLKQFTPAYEKLSEENQRRLITRWTKYYNQIVEPRIEKIQESLQDPDEQESEEGGGLPEDLQVLLDAAQTLASAQQSLEEALEEAGGPLSRSMAQDREIGALDEKIREGFSALREKADERGYDFDTILDRTPLEPVRENPDTQQQVEKFTEAALDEHVEIARRSNPEYTRETYPGVFEDFDNDNIPTVDDPHPLIPGDENTVEEVSLAREIEKLLEFREGRAQTTEEAKDRLSRWVPGDSTIKSRTKTPYSILNKLRRKRLEGPQGIEDVSGAMVVVRDISRLEEIRGLIEEDEVIGEVREVENHYDLPGPYRAVHYIVEVGGAPVEVQLKTQRQASLANAAHGPYKRGTIDNSEMGRIAELAHRADTGDEEAAAEVDPMLSDLDALEDRLTERENPPAEASVDVPGGPNSTVNQEDQDAHRPRLNPPVGLPYRYQQMIREEVRNAYAESPPSKANAILPDGSTWAQDLSLFSDVTEEEDETLARISRLLPGDALDSDVLIRQAGGIETAWPWTNAISARTPLTNEQKDALREAEQELDFEGAEVTAYTPTDLSFDLEPNTVETTVGSADEAISFLEENLATVGIEAPADGLPEDFEGGFPSGAEVVNRGFVNTDEDPEAFYNWFGESVITQNGEPKLLYHGTLQLMGDFNRDYIEDGLYFTDSFAVAREFGKDRLLVPKEVTADILKDRPAEFGVAISEREDGYVLNHNGAIVLRGASEAQVDEALEVLAGQMNAQSAISKFGAGVVPAYLKLENPLVTDFEGNRFHSHPGEYESAQEIAQIAIEGEYDGAIMKNIIEGFDSMDTVATNYLALRPDQIAPVAEDDGVVSVPGAGHRENPPAEASVDVPDGPSYTVEPGDVILREGVFHEDLSREKVAAPPEEARRLAQKARKWKEKGAPGMHETGLRRMLQIGAGYQLSPAELRVVKNWFARKKSEKEKGYHKMEDWAGHDEKRPSESLLSWWGWGGEPMMEWAENKLDEMPDRVRLSEEAFENRENPRKSGEGTIREAFGDASSFEPPMPESPLLDLADKVVYPQTATDYGFELRATTLGETYAYGFSRRPDFDGEEYDSLAELGWIQVDEFYRGQGIGLRLLGDVLRWLRSTGASHVAVRPLSDASNALNEKAEEMGLWHLSMEGGSGMEMYAIDVAPKSMVGVPVTGASFEFNAGRDDVEDAVRFLYEPSDAVWNAGAQPTGARPWTYMQPLRPATSSGDLESEFNRDVEIYETFAEAPGVSQTNGFFFRTDAPITVDDLTRTSVQPVGIDTRTWTLVNAVNSYQEGPGLPEFAVINRSKKWLMELEQGEGETDGKTLLTFSRAGNRAIETHEHPSLQDALEESLRFRDRGDQVEYLPMEFVDTALDQWEEEERENPAEKLTEEGVARAVEALAYDLREFFWDRGYYPFRLHEATGQILRVGEKIREGEIEVDPLAFDPIPYSELPRTRVNDIESLMESLGDLRSVQEYAEEEILPFIEEDMETAPFDPFKEKGLLPLVKRQLRTAPDWQSTGYLMPDGTPLSLGGRGANRKDHRDVHVPDRLIPDWLDPERNFSSMVAIMEAGVIRVKPGGFLGLDMHTQPTREQKEWVREAILSSSPPSEVIVDVSRPGKDATESDSARLSPLPRKVIRFIEDFYSGRGGSKVARFQRENPDGTLSKQMARLYPTWKPRGSGSKIEAQHVKWIMPGGQAIGAKPESGDEIHHNHFELPEGVEAEEMPRRELVDRGAVSLWVTNMSGIDHVSVNVVSGAPLTDAQKTTLRDLVSEIEADTVVGALSDARGKDAGSVPSEQIEADSAEAFIGRVEDFYASDAGRQNPDEADPAFIIAVGDTQSANLQNFKPESQKLVTMSPGKYLKHVREHFEDTPGGDFETARDSITRKSPHVVDERIQEMKDRMTGRKPLDALWFDVRLGQQGTDSPIIGQEGRHRAIAAKELGIRHVPVILWAHRQKKGKGMFGGIADVKVPAEGEEFPERIMAGATEIQWPESPTATETLWRRAKFGREFV